MFGLDTIINTGLQILDKFIPDPKAKEEASIEMMKIKQSSDFKELDNQLQQLQMQADTNKVEAANEHVFVSGWRPFIGWICGCSIGLQFVLFPLMTWVGQFWGVHMVFPELPSDMLYTLIFGMLGIGGMRSYEKVKINGKPGG